MRVSREQAAQNRNKILTSAARLFREHGIGATGVDAITQDAGLTHGAIYSQFGSKEAIAAETMREALAGSQRLWRRLAQRVGAKRAFLAILETYLSRDHRDSAGRGCVVAALGSELSKQSDRVREVFTVEFRDGLEFLAQVMRENGRHGSYDDAIFAFASMVGALTLARAVNDERLSNRILKATAKQLVHLGRAENRSDCASRNTVRSGSLKGGS